MNKYMKLSNLYFEISPIYETKGDIPQFEIDFSPKEDFSISLKQLSKKDSIYRESDSLNDTEKVLDNNYKDVIFKNSSNNSKNEKEGKNIDNKQDKLVKIKKENIFLHRKIFKKCDDICSSDIKEKKSRNKIIINNCIFGVKSHKTIEPRIDYAIKNFKVNLMQFLKNYVNNLIKECDFQNELKHMKLFAPSYKYFTGVTNERFNKNSLKLTMEDIFTYPDKRIEKDDNRLQRQNKNMINRFKDFINKNYYKKASDKIEKLENFFKMTFEESIQLFYKSKQFNDYSSLPKTIYLDEEFPKTRGYSLIKNNGFIQYAE